MRTTRIAADANAVTGFVPGTRIKGFSLIGGSGASNAKLYDAATVTGNAILEANALTADMKTVMFEDGGQLLNVGLSVDLTGTGAVLYVYSE